MSTAYLEDLPVLDVSEVLNETAVDLMVKITNGLTVVTLSIAAVLVFLIFKVSPHYMAGLKPYLLFYVITGTADHMTSTLFKSVIIFPYYIMYPVGWLAPMSRTTAQVLAWATYICIFGLLTSQLMMLIDRFFALTVINVNFSPFYKKPSLYLVLCSAVSAVSCAVIGYSIFFTDKFLSGEVAVQAVSSKIVNLNKLLERQSELLLMNKSLPIVLQKVMLIASSVGGGFFLSLFVIFITLNTVYVRKCTHLTSRRLRKNHNMILRMAFAQIFGIVTFIFGPHVYFNYFASHYKSTGYCIALIVRDMFFIYDGAVTIAFIKPYKSYLYSQLMKLLHVQRASVTRASSKVSDILAGTTH